MPEFDSYDAFDARETLAEDEALDLQKQGVLAVDPERALPLWFDGRYLSARDLNREQNYFLSRQTAIGKAMGRGVIEGLEVRPDSAAGLEGAQLEITAGQGVAFDGAHILLPQNLKVNLSDLAVQDALNAKLGLSAHPAAPIRARTGIFVLSLRAVEYTANQTAAFPTHVTGERSATMGDRIEAVAVTITPFAPIDAPFDSDEARSVAALRLFQGMEETGTPGNALPLAMLALRNGAIEWLDVHMVRRDLVASRRDFLGLGLSRDQLRLAHFNQYRAQMTDLVTAYADRGQPARFNAEQHFRVLPAAGPLPAATIDPAAQTQLFFPGEIEVELSIVPEDELPVLIDDSFELPPIDLTRRAEDRDSLSVMVLAPLPRHLLRSQIGALGQLRRPLRPISLMGQGPQKPIDRLGTMRIALAEVGAALEAEAEPAAEAWADVIRALASFGTAGDPAAPMLWYIRRRTLRENADLESALATIQHVDDLDEADPLDPDEPIAPPEVEVDDPKPAPEPEPEPEPEETLSDEERDVLVRLGGFGDLSRIVRAQMVRLPDNARTVYAAMMAERPLMTALGAVAMTARVAELRRPNANQVKQIGTSLVEAPTAGLLLLNAALMRGEFAKITEKGFKQLSALVVPDTVMETAMKATASLGSRGLQEFAGPLTEAILEAEPELVEEVVAKMAEEAAARVRRADQQRRAEADAAARAAQAAKERAAAEAAKRRAEQMAKEQAKRLVASIKDKTQSRSVERMLNKADGDTRNRIVTMLTRAGIGRSRIATAVVEKELRTGGTVKADKIVKLRPIDSNFVMGLSVLEPRLLAPPKVKKPAPKPKPNARGARANNRNQATIGRQLQGNQLRNIRGLQPGVMDAVRRQQLQIKLNTPEMIVNRRVATLSQNGALRSLSNFGRLHRSKPVTLNKMSARLIPILDKQPVNQKTIRSVIIRAVREIR